MKILPEGMTEFEVLGPENPMTPDEKAFLIVRQGNVTDYVKLTRGQAFTLLNDLHTLLYGEEEPF